MLHRQAKATGYGSAVSFLYGNLARRDSEVLAKGKALTTYMFTPKAGRVDVGPFVIPQAGHYQLTLRLTDAAGKTRGLSWPIVAE